MNEAIKLTQTVKKGGCAAKLPAGELKKVLEKLQQKQAPELLVGMDTMDDACLWKLNDNNLLIQTLDFFTPIVDDPYSFGTIAAANSISDVYAMGGTPKIALSILAFPMSTLPIEILEPIMMGAMEKIQEAGASLAGGHSIDDETLKLGFSVTGFVENGKEWTNAGAKPGDVLILTKALGTGTIASAIKNNLAKEEWISGAIASMCKLNNAVELLHDVPVHAATDITGFGLGGHCLQLAQASNVSLEINTSALPLLPGLRELLEQGCLNRAHKTNFDYIKEKTNCESLEKITQHIVSDAQTSGGLLLVIPEAHADAAIKALCGRFPLSKIIGRVHAQNKKGRQDAGPNATIFSI